MGAKRSKVLTSTVTGGGEDLQPGIVSQKLYALLSSLQYVDWVMDTSSVGGGSDEYKR